MNSRIAVLILSLSFGAVESLADWRAAVRKVDITPMKEMWMGGYSSRKGPGSGSTTKLFAKVLVLADGKGARLAMVTLDLIGVPRPLRLELEKRVGDEFDLSPAELFLNASHTHSGPMIRLIPGFAPGKPDRAAFDRVPDDEEAKYVALAQEYRRKLAAGIVRGIGECLAALEPVELLFSEARCGLAMNRRFITERGVSNSPNPDGPVDHSVPVLQVRSMKKELKAILFGYACHSTVLSFMTFSGDYPGWAQQYLEEAHPGAVAMFVAGCGGDQNPYPRRLPHWAPRHGRSLANAVEAGLIANPKRLTEGLRTAFAIVDLDYATPPTRKQLAEKAKAANRYDRRHAEFLLEYWDATGSLRKNYPYPVQVMRIGDGLTMVALGGEAVVDYSLRFKRELTKEHLWVAGYSNDVMGYIPSLRVLQEGGYEAGGAMRYVRAIPHPGPWSDSVEADIVGTVRGLYDRVHR
jgi:neutral ceramidase